MMMLRLAIPCLGQNGGAPWKVAQASEQLEAARRHRVLTRRQKKIRTWLFQVRIFSGGEGSRTPVREPIPPSLYVRILLFLSPRPFVGQ